MQRQGERGEEWISGGFRVEGVPPGHGPRHHPAAGRPPGERARGPGGRGTSSTWPAGPAGSCRVTVRAQILPREFPFIDEFEDFTFANGPVAVGTARQREEYYGEETEDFAIEGEASAPEPAPAKPTVHQRDQLVLDQAGTARTDRREPAPREPGRRSCSAEMEFRDPNGELRTVAARVPLWPAQRLVGLQPEGWAASKERAEGLARRGRRRPPPRRRGRRSRWTSSSGSSTPTASASWGASTPTST